MPDDHSVFDELVAAVIEATDEGLNTLVTGPPGSGQATFTNALADELAFERRIVRVVGVQAWRRKSFAALSVLKPARPIEGAAEYRLRPPRRVRYTELLVDAAGMTGVLVVEQPELLDADSAGAIAMASRQAHVPVVAISGQDSPYRASAAFLNNLAPPLRRTLPLLTLAQIHSVTQSILGAPVEGETIARIAAQSAGLYDMVVGIATVGMRTGALALNDGRWGAVRELVTGDMAGWIEQLAAGVPERERDILRRMAAASVLGEDYAVASDEFGPLGRLMEVGLVREQSGRLSVYPPLVADYVRSQRQLVQRDTVSLRAASSGDLTSALVLAMGRNDAGSDVALSHRIRRHGLATTDALRADWAEAPNAARAVPLLVALQNTGAAPDALRDVLDRTAYAPETIEYALMRVWWATYLSLTLRRLDDGLASLQPIEDDAPGWRALVAATRAHLRIAAGNDARPAAEESTPEAGTAADDLGLGRLVQLERVLIGGRSRSALDLADAGAAGAGGARGAAGAVHPVFATGLTIARNVAMIFEGRVHEAIDVAREEMIAAEDKLNLGLIYAHTYVKMLGLFVAGRVTDAHRVLNRVLTLGTARALHEPYQVGILDLGVIIETLRAEPARAVVLADTVIGITGVDLHRGGLPGMSGFSAQRVHQPADIAPRLWTAAVYCAETGQLVTAVFAGVASLIARFNRRHADTLQGWAAQAESPLLRLLGRFGAALDRTSPDTLVALADEFLAVEAGVYFGRARVQAARAYYERGDRTRGFELACETWHDTEFMGPDRAGLFSELWAEIGLSDREAQVARAGAFVTSARDIATELHLSQRTVENYLYSAYRKAGTTSREELGAAGNQWLRAAAAHLVGPLI